MSSAVQWVVFSELSTDAMIATGITSESATATSLIETTLAEVGNASWGEILRLPVAGEIPGEAELSQWPPPGEVYVCRRSAGGGYRWVPLFPPG